MKKINCLFDTVAERDMDFMIMEEFSRSQEFADLFLDKIGKKGAELLEIQHSKRRKYVGESDIVLTFAWNGMKHAILIEDKIDADAMPDQSGRYFKRGDWDVKDGHYDSYDVFIVAPEGYLRTNDEAILYPNRVSYEEIESYMMNKGSKEYTFRLMMIDKALGRQRSGYQCVENKDMTAFWAGYLDIKDEMFSDLIITNADGKKGANSHWVNFASPIPNTQLRHKGKQGYIDLEFKGMADRQVELLNALQRVKIQGGDICGVVVTNAGKSAVLRLETPKLEFLGDFSAQEKDVRKCLEAVCKMINIAKSI